MFVLQSRYKFSPEELKLTSTHLTEPISQNICHFFLCSEICSEPDHYIVVNMISPSVQPSLYVHSTRTPAKKEKGFRGSSQHFSVDGTMQIMMY